jgi:tetratricopeptide (TPR) repeat protein
MNNEEEKGKQLVIKRAKAAIISRDYALASRLYKSLLKNDSANIGYLGMLGDIFVKAGEDKKALPYFEQVITFSPNNFTALNSMGGIYRRLKKYDDSIRVLQEALETGLNDAQVNYNLGFTYKFMGNYDDAIECFESVIEENPNDVLAYNHIGAIYALRNNHAKAVAAYKRGLQIDPNHPILQLNLAQSYVALHDYDNAEISFEAALRAKPGWLDAVRGYTELLLSEHKTKNASELIKKTIQLYPDDIHIQKLLGRIFLKRFDFSSAVNTFKNACKIDDKNIGVLSGLAEAYEKSNKPEEAVAVMKTAENIAPDNKKIQKQYAHVLLSADELDSAGVKIKKLYDDDKTDVQILDLQGQYYICKKDEKSAEWCFKKIKELDPEYVDYFIEAAGRFHQTGVLEKGKQFAEEYLKRRKDDPAGFISLAKINEASGDIENALDNYHRALKYDQFNVFAKKAVKRIGDEINDKNKIRWEKEEKANEVPADLEIMEDAPEKSETEPPAVEKQEEPFDFDMMGDSLIKADDDKSPFDFADAADEAEKNEEETQNPEGLDELVPSGEPIDNSEKNNENADDVLNGDTVTSLQPDTPADSPFSAENIEDVSENEKTGEPVSEAESRPPVSGVRTPSVPQKIEQPDEPVKPAEAEETEERTAQLSKEAASSLSDAVEKVTRNAERAVQAAERALNAAQTAADSAQSVDSAKRYINQVAEDTAKKTAVAANTAGDELNDNREQKDTETEPQSDPEAYTQLIDDTARLLPGIVAMLEQKENAEKFSHLLSLFRKLQMLGTCLPDPQKHEFMISRTRLLLEYVIARLSGKPGLLCTVEALRSNITDELLPEVPVPNVTRKEHISAVFAEMRMLASYLPDHDLSRALDDSADEVEKKL